MCVVLVALPLISACTPPAPQPGEVVKLTYSILFPPTHLHSILAQKWADEIKAKTNGRVEITCYPGGTLTPAPKIYDGVATGISDIGMSVLAYTIGPFPVSELVDLPWGYPNGWVATKVANDYYTKFKPKEFDNTQVMYFHAHGPGLVLTAKKAVNTLDDMKGMVLRSTGVGAKIAESLGAKGYAAAQGEAYELMSKGTIDGSLTPLEVLKGWKQAEVVKYVTGCYDIGYTADMFVVMNKAKWTALPNDVKNIITKVNEEWIEKHAQVWSYYDKAALDYFLTFPERKLITLSKDEMARWDAAIAPFKAAYIAEKAAKGLPTAEYTKYLAERVKYWAGKSPSEKQSVDWVEKNIPQPAAK